MATRAAGGNPLLTMKQKLGGLVGETGRMSLERDEASVFAVVEMTVTGAGDGSGEQSQVVRLDIGMVETDSGWKVDRVDILQAPGSVLPGAPGGPG